MRRPIVPDDPELLTTALAEAVARSRSRPARRRLREGPRRPRRRGDRGGGRGRRAGSRDQAGAPGRPRPHRLDAGDRRAGLPGLGGARLRALRRQACRRARRPTAHATPTRPGGRAPRDPVDDRKRGVGSGARRPGRRRPRRNPAATRGRRAQLARTCRRSRPRGARNGPSRLRRAGGGRAAPPARRDRGDAARDRLDRPPARRACAAAVPRFAARRRAEAVAGHGRVGERCRCARRAAAAISRSSRRATFLQERSRSRAGSGRSA